MNHDIVIGSFKFIKNMKVVFLNVTPDLSAVDSLWAVYDSGNNFLTNFLVSLALGTEIAPNTPGATLTATMNTKVIAGALALGYTIAASDIIWAGYCPYYPNEIGAIQAAVSQSPVYSTPTFSSSTTATKLSVTRESLVAYDYDAALTISLLTGQSVTALLKYADDSGMSTNVVLVSSQQTNISGVLGLSNTQTLKVSGGIPANKFRQVTFTVTGSATAPTAIKAGQEKLI